MLAPLARRQVDARRGPSERARGAFCGENPCSEASDAQLGIELRRQRMPVEVHRTATAAAVELLRVPSDSARDGLPRDALHRIARLISAKTGEVTLVVARHREL